MRIRMRIRMGCSAIGRSEIALIFNKPAKVQKRSALNVKSGYGNGAPRGKVRNYAEFREIRKTFPSEAPPPSVKY